MLRNNEKKIYIETVSVNNTVVCIILNSKYRVGSLEVQVLYRGLRLPPTFNKKKKNSAMVSAYDNNAILVNVNGRV